MPDPLHNGDKAAIMSGPFEGKVGTIAAINEDVASATVDVFARDTPVQVPLADLARGLPFSTANCLRQCPTCSAKSRNSIPIPALMWAYASQRESGL